MTPEERHYWQIRKVTDRYRDDLDVLRRVQQHNRDHYTPAVVARVKGEHRDSALRALQALGYEHGEAAEMLRRPPAPPRQPPRTTAEFMNKVIRGG